MERDWTKILAEYPDLKGPIETPNKAFRKLLERFGSLKQTELRVLYGHFESLAAEAHEDSNADDFEKDPWVLAAASQDPDSSLNVTAHDAAYICSRIAIATRLALEAKDLSHNVDLIGCLNASPQRYAKTGESLLEDFYEKNWTLTALIEEIADRRGVSAWAVWKAFKQAGYQTGSNEKEEHIVEIIRFTCRAARYVGEYWLTEPRSSGASVSFTIPS